MADFDLTTREPAPGQAGAGQAGAAQPTNSGAGPGGPGSVGPLKSFRGWSVVRQFPAQGGEADVYLVEKENQQRVLKLYRFGISPKREVFERISRLGEKHPACFIRIHEFGDDPESGCFFELEEFAGQGTLAENLDGKKLPEAQVLQIVTRIAEALFILHDDGILHLDLKPANVLLRSIQPLDPVLSDFGISSIFDAELSKKLTQTKGTSLYQSPESITGVVIPKSDWWSLGIMALEFLLGKHPFDGLQRQVILYQLTTKGIEIPEEISRRWRNLLMGLLTRNPDKRWGQEQVKQWLSGAIVPTHYEEELAQSQGNKDQQGLSATSSFKRFDFPFSLGETEFSSVEELFEAMFRTPAIWEEGKAALCRGGIASWLEQNKDVERAEQLRRLAEEEPEPDSLLFKAGVFFRADLPFAWRGRPIEDGEFLSLLEKASDERDPPEDRPLIEGLFSGRLFQDYIRFTGKDLGKLGAFWRISQAMKGTDLEKLPLPRKTLLIWQAYAGAFSGNQALPSLQRVLEPSSGNSDAIFAFVQTKGFSQFAQKAGLWQPGDAELWTMSGKIAARKTGLQGIDFREFFQQADLVTVAARKDPSLREFIVRIFSRGNVDIHLLKQIQDFAGSQPWIDTLIRLVYRLPPGEKLDICLSNLMVSAALNARWTEISGSHLVPPWLVDLQKGKMVSPAKLRMAREILDDPELLPRKSDRFKTWEELDNLLLPATHLDQESLEFLEFARKEGLRLSRSSTDFSRRDFMAVGIIMLILLFFTFPGAPRNRGGLSRERSCYANMRVILGAVEMYNMDNAEMMRSEIDFNRLLGVSSYGAYLRQMPVCPGPGVYGTTGDLADTGKIVCSIHGTVD